MRRADALRLTARVLLCLAAGGVAGCGGGKPAGGSGGLTFEQLADTAGLSQGPAILDSIRVGRMTGGSMRIRAHARLPEGTRVRVAIKPAGGRSSLVMTEVVVQDGTVETPPLMAPSGPLPVASYRVEFSASFAVGTQPATVLRATDDGRSLRGPGITRTRAGGAMFWWIEEVTR